MKSVAVIFVAALALVAVTTAVDEAASREESSFAEATSFVQNFLAQGENDETACEKVANTAIDAIKEECATLQKDIDERANNNKHCCNSGLDNIDTAKKAHEASKAAHSTCLEELAKDKEQKVSYGDVAFSALNQDQCKSQFYTSNSAYQAALKAVNDKTASCAKIDGETTGLSKAVDDSVYAACLSRGKCESDAEDAKDKTFSDSNAACGSQKNKDAFTRAHHMKCVLAGKTLQGCTVPTAPSVTNTKMYVNQCELKCELMNNFEHSSCNGGGIKGFRIDHTCGQNVMGMLINKDNKWQKNKTYHCPEGWYWATSDKWFTKLKNWGCSGNNQKSTTDGHAMYSRCGFSAYHPPKAGGGHDNSVQKYYFRFADSKSNNDYQHAGNYIGYKNTGAGVDQFGGICCIKNGH
jgi:hypothetical protein